MTPEQEKRQQQLRPHVLKTIERVGAYGTAEGWLRYEAIKKLNLRQIDEIFQLKLNSNGENLDEMIDELILNQTPQ